MAGAGTGTSYRGRSGRAGGVEDAPPSPPAPPHQRLDGALNGRVPHLASSSAPTSWRRLSRNRATKMDQLIKPQALLCAMLLLATARWYCSWRCNFTALLISAGGGDALGGLSSSAVGGSTTLSGNRVAVLIWATA